MWHDVLLKNVQNCDVGDNQGIQGACGKMVTSRVVMMGRGRDSRGLVMIRMVRDFRGDVA